MADLPRMPAVLVADDSPAFCQKAREVLMKQGFEVTTASTGLEAIAAVRKGSYDLVTLDIEMPEMDGIEALRILRVMIPEVPVIMVSGASTVHTAISALRQGAYDYILKPFDADDLALSVARALKQRALVEENKKLVADLKRFNEHLEELVRERTQALERSERKLLDYAHELEKAHAELVNGHEELREAYRKLRELDGLKAKFIAITSHELRTPLTAIYGYAALAAEGKLPEVQQTKALQAIQRNVERLVATVGEITDIARLKDKRLYLRRESLDLGELLAEVARDFAPLSEGRRLTVKTRIAEPLPRILADRGRMLQVLQHLVLNAIRFTPDGGEVELTVSPVDGPPENPVRTLVTVSDTGIGIDDDKLTTIFEEFYEAGPWQHHHSGRTAFGSSGLGLGLSVVKGLVEEHAGRIWAQSAKSSGGKGSTFSILLPALEAEAAP